MLQIIEQHSPCMRLELDDSVKKLSDEILLFIDFRLISPQIFWFP
jgi:hypothetical protein